MAVSQCRGFGLKGVGGARCTVNARSRAHSSAASLLLFLSSPLCQGATIGHFSSELLLKEWGWAKLESEVGRVASWVALPCPGKALAVADCIILFPSSLFPGASDGLWCCEGVLGRAVGERSANWYPSPGVKVCVTHGWETWTASGICPWSHIAGAWIGERQKSEA